MKQTDENQRMIEWYLLKYRKDIVVNLDVCTQEKYFSKVKEKF